MFGTWKLVSKFLKSLLLISYYAGIMLNTFASLLYAQTYAGVIGASLVVTELISEMFLILVFVCNVA